MEDKIKEKLLRDCCPTDEEWNGWKIVSEMLNNPNEDEIYPTTICYQKLANFVRSQKLQQHEETKKAMTEEFLKKIDEVFDSLNHLRANVPYLKKQLKQSIQGE